MTRFSKPASSAQQPASASLVYANAARLCLYAPAAAIFLVIVGIVLAQDPSVATALAWLRVLVLVAGFGAGIYALTGISKVGKEGILGKSIAGLIINGLLLSAVVSYLISGPALPHALIKRQMDQSFTNDAGWVGMYRDSSTVAMTFSIDPAAPLAKLISKDLAQDATILVYGAQTGKNSYPTQCTLVSLTDAKGKKYQPLDPAGVFASGKEKRWAAYMDIAKAPAHDCLAFLPADVPLQQITAATMTVDGRTVQLSGKYLLPSDKSQRAPGQ